MDSELEVWERMRYTRIYWRNTRYLAGLNTQRDIVHDPIVPWYVELARTLGDLDVRLGFTCAETTADMATDLSALQRPNCEHGVAAQWQEMHSWFRTCWHADQFMLVDGRWHFLPPEEGDGDG
jgi:hypothetical protein